MMLISSDREFQVWKYTVGHRQLLLRSTKSPQHPTRVDVFFKGVSEFHLPTSLTGLFITEVSESEVQDLCMLSVQTSPETGSKVFKVEGKHFVGYVAALALASHEDEGEYYDPSFFAKENIL